MKEELWESFPPCRDGAMRGMRADGESREQQQQQWRRWRGRSWRRRRRRCCWGSRRRAAREEPAALPEEAAVGQLPRRRQDVPQHEEGGVFLAHAVPLQGGLHQQHHLPHVRLQGGCKRPEEAEEGAGSSASAVAPSSCVFAKRDVETKVKFEGKPGIYLSWEVRCDVLIQIISPSSSSHNASLSDARMLVSCCDLQF